MSCNSLPHRALPALRTLPAGLASLAVLGVLALFTAPPAGAGARATVTTPVLAAPAEAPTDAPRLVEVDLSGRESLNTLLRAGLDVVDVRDGRARLLAWLGDEARLAKLGLAVRVVDEHPGRTAATRAHADLALRKAPPSMRVRSATGRDGIFRVQTLPPFGSGSMGGFWTTAEVKMKLDQLVSSDASNLVADKLDTLGYSREGRPIWGLKIAKAVGGPDTRPVVFMNALTHAREPEGMQVLFYFVDDLLSRYGTDPFVTYLLDKRQLYIVPIVNPDGYAVNESIYTASGGTSFGFWRKNTRDNNANHVFDQANDGVDINRNFGFQWGVDDLGSSPVISDETYRGPSAFSESETKVQRDAVIALKPTTGFSFHTYSDLMLHAWGYTATNPPDIAALREWSDELTRDNASLSGQAINILYPVNGEFNDWVYGETVAKPRAFTWTPEIGNEDDGFWPPPSRIIPLSQKMLRACYVVTALAGPFVQEDGVTLLEGAMNAGRLTNVRVKARNLGVTGSAGPGLTGTLVALDPAVHVLQPTIPYPTLGTRQSADPTGASTFQVSVDDTVTPGRLLSFEVRFTDGTMFSRDTIVVPCGTPTVVFADGASSGLGNWTPGTWGIVQNDAAHPSRYFADSPAGNYSSNADNRLILKPRLNLTAGVHAYAFYEARWEFEQDWDGGSLEASTDSVTWNGVRATGSTPGSGIAGSTQVLGRPYYGGARRAWRPEIADLSAYTGAGRTQVKIRFRSQADGSTEFDGLNVDSLRVVVYDPAVQPAPVAVAGASIPRALELAAPFPNPAHEFARFEFGLPRSANATLEILDIQGRRTRVVFRGVRDAGRYVGGWDLKDDSGRRVAPGVYLSRLTIPGAQVVRRIAVID